MTQNTVEQDQALKPGDVIERHRLSTRVWHWVNALTLLVLLMSGLMIFNAHPRLYWGQYGANTDYAWLVIDDVRDTGFIDFAGAKIETTGVFGIWDDAEGVERRRAFPHWMTIPSDYDLQAARRWHLTFAWILSLALAAYMARSVWNGHIRRDLHIRKSEWSPAHIWHDIKVHARLRFPTGRGGKELQYITENQLYRRNLYSSAADNLYWHCHVPRDERGLARTARYIRGTAIGAIDPLYLRLCPRAFFLCSHIDGVAGRTDQRNSIDNYRSLPVAWRGSIKMTDSKFSLPRRRFLNGAALGTGGLLLSGCDMLTENVGFRSFLRSGEALNKTAHRLISDRSALAPEFLASDISPIFRANGSISGATPEYAAHVAERFANWQLKIDGMVTRPISLSLNQLMAMPSREQITRHDCVEGWSAIGKWRGTPLGLLLKQAGMSTKARYIVFHCADSFGADPYYESIDLIDAFHPQTILAWSMNEKLLPVRHGAPLRLRVERQLGYKHAKYVMRIEATDSLAKFYGGKGGYWEDQVDYDWYAGI